MYLRPKNKAERLEARKIFLDGYTVKENKDADCVIATLNENNRYYLRIFNGSSCNPVVNCWYIDESSRTKEIEKHIANRIEIMKSKQERKQAKNAAGKYTIDTSKPYFEVGSEYFMNYYIDDPWESTAIIRIIRRTTCFVTIAHVYGDKLNDEKRVKVSCDESGELLSFGSFYYFHAYNKVNNEPDDFSDINVEEVRKELEKWDGKDTVFIEQVKKDIERAQEQEAAFKERNEGRKYIEEISEQYPIKNGEPVVTINWSEHPAFYSWDDGELKLSIPSADIILKHFDEERYAKNQKEGHGGYYKTSFVIEYMDACGDSSTYEGCYDFGDNDGGLIEHIRAFAESYRNPKMYGYSEEKAAEIEAVSDLLRKYTVQNQAGGHTDGQIISVSFAPWFEGALEKIADERKKEFDDIVDMLDIMTDDQLISAIMSFPSNCSDVELGAVRLIIQRLAMRDQKKAFEVFRTWKNGDRM